MPKNKIQLSTQEEQQLSSLLVTSKKQLDEMSMVMPETKKVVEQCPGINPMGYYSEIDMGFAERMKRCENAIQMRDPIAGELYQSVKGKIEKSSGYMNMKKEMMVISKKIRVIDRALRLCENDNIANALEAKREELTNSSILKDYSMFLNVMEYQSGAQLVAKEADKSNQTIYEITEFCQRKFNLKIGSPLHCDPYKRNKGFTNPKKLEIEFENFDEIVTHQRMMEDENLGKTRKQVKAEPMDIGKSKKYLSSMPGYMQASCDRVLDSTLPNVKDRADLIFIDGVSVRERMQEEEELKGKEPTDEQIKKYSSLYVTAALRKGSYVETFVRSINDNEKINYDPVPITTKGKDSYILKKSSDNEVEKLTISFLDRFLAKLGFKYFVNKIKNVETMASKIKRSRETFRTAHKQEMKYALGKNGREERKLAFEAAHKYKDGYLKIHEKMLNFSNTQLLLDRQFFPNGKPAITNKASGLVVDPNREKLRMMIIAQMLKDNYTLEQILDPAQLADEKAQTTQKVAEELENCDKKTFFAKHMEVTDVLQPAIEKYAADHKISFKNPESIWGDPAAYLLDLSVGAGNISDFILKSALSKEVDVLFGEGTCAKENKKTLGSITIGMLPTFMGKSAGAYFGLGEGTLPNPDQFSTAIKAEMITAVFAKLEKPGQVFNPPIGVDEMEVIHCMLMAHPKIEEFYNSASKEELMDIMAKGHILKDLKVDFEILPEKMMTGIDIDNDVFSVYAPLGNPDNLVSVVPTFDGSSDYYEMDTQENVLKKMEEMENSEEMENTNEL